MTAYSLPAFIALVFKLVLLGYAVHSRVRNDKTRMFLFFLIALSLHNLSEVVLLNYFPRFGLDGTLEAIGYSYFATLIPFIAILLHLSLRLTLEGRTTAGLPYALLYVPAVTLEFLLLFTDTVVTGFRPFQFSIIRVPGPWYFLFETYFTLYLAAALVNLAFAARSAGVSSITRTRNRLWLMGMTPMGLMMIYMIISRHMSWPQLSSTFYVPIAQAFFLLVATYATHQYRLFDIEFYIPGSRVRARKTVFYQRIQATVAELADLRSVDEAMGRVADILKCPAALVGGWRPVLAHAGEGSLEIAEFPAEPLTNLDRIVVANEIEHAMPELHRLMKQFRIAAIVPFHPRSKTAASWMLLGDSFSDAVYTPLDFRQVERLFDRLGEFFLDKIAMLRTEIGQAQEQAGSAEERADELEKEAIRTQEEIAMLRECHFRLLRENDVARKALDFPSPQSKTTPILALIPKSGQEAGKSLDEQVAELEARRIREALERCGGNKSEAALLLGLKPNTLHYKIRRYRLDAVDDT